MLQQAIFSTTAGQDAGVSICWAIKCRHVRMSRIYRSKQKPPLEADYAVEEDGCRHRRHRVAENWLSLLAARAHCGMAREGSEHSEGTFDYDATIDMIRLYKCALCDRRTGRGEERVPAQRQQSAEILPRHWRLSLELLRSLGLFNSISFALETAVASPRCFGDEALPSAFRGFGNRCGPVVGKQKAMGGTCVSNTPPQTAAGIGKTDTGCDDLTGLYLRLSQWDREGTTETHNFYDVSTTFILLSRGASFARLPSLDQEAEMDQVTRGRLLDSLARIGGYPERCGICVAAEDTVSEGIDSRFRLGTTARTSSRDPVVTQHVKQRLPAGKYCHALALDRRPWDDLHVSPLEIQEMFARDVAHARKVLLLRGPTAPDDGVLRAPLRFATSVQAITVSTSTLLGGFDGLIEDMAGLLVGVDLLLLIGLPTGFGALLAVELSCRYGVQALDVGQFSLAAAPGQRPAPPLTTLGSGEETPTWEPQLRRATQPISLNGPWQIQITTDTARQEDLVEGAWRTIEVPFPPQAYKGLATKISASEAVWYRRRLQVPASWCAADKTIWLQVDACDWECAVYLDSQLLGVHRGGYDAFRLEMPPSVCSHGVALLVRAWDPTDEGCPFTDRPPIPCETCCESGWQPRGKQSLKPGSIMYTAVTGIWRQGLFMEVLPRCHIRDLHVDVHKDAPRKLTVMADATCQELLSVEVLDSEGALIGMASGPCCELHATLEKELRLWSPEDPQCYTAHVSLGSRTSSISVERHFARRFLAVQEGRLLLNGKVMFVHGVLYQGYWPESLLTPPDVEAVGRDLRMIKAAGFNTIRVHAVVMGEAFYALCDKLGLLVWQDMPAGDMRAMPTWSEVRAVAEEEIGMEAQRLNLPVRRALFDEIRRSHASQTAFEVELQAMVRALSHFASVTVWVLFNEGWGQSNTQAWVALLRQLDPSRLIDANSGWNEVEGPALGDFADLHNYEDNSSIFGPLAMSFQNFAEWGYNVAGRVPALGEYGGVGYAVEGHRWSSHGAWGYGEKQVNHRQDVYATALEKLLLRLLPCICNGLGAAIYTQWNDVETEVNGLLTYDRQLKLPLEFYQEFSRLVRESARKCMSAPDEMVSGLVS
ncbi:unnamed protein product [Symbiodinium natans]|uniref:Glycoside hydrolase family 2 catalytic domain-containing protein n=1 Tax=Symbiodinium natans TaxID=878477 RepID=A0A812JCA9_9DINO|nr:unnamed protein product [Symbiodinium natans]